MKLKSKLMKYSIVAFSILLAGSLLGISTALITDQIVENNSISKGDDQFSFTFSGQKDIEFKADLPHPTIWHNISEITWIDNKTVSLTAYAYYDAWDAIIVGGGYRIENNTIYLYYTLTWDSCARCSWYGKYDMLFTLTNIEMKEYDFILERQDIGSCNMMEND